MTRATGTRQLPEMTTIAKPGEPRTSSELQDRVRTLRLMNRWDQAMLAERSGLSATAVSHLESGRATPSEVQVIALARAFGVQPAFLVAELGLRPPTKPWLRAYADASKRETDARTAEVAVATEYIRRLRLRVLPDRIPVIGGDVDDDHAIEDLAAEARRLAGVEEGKPVLNAVRAAERLGCVVLPLESEMGRHLGMSLRSDGIPVIAVASHGVPGDRQRFTVSHELGHLSLHSGICSPQTSEDSDRLERQANRFAAAFLTPEAAVLESLRRAGGRVTLTSLTTIKAEWGVAIKSLVGRFKELGVIDSEHARSLYKQISARRWTKQEPVDVPLESAQWFAKRLVRAAQAETIEAAVRTLATSSCGSPAHLWGFTDWTTPREDNVVAIFEHRRRSISEG
jgi:Zn-dependent peptidase ImmA (M78 family)/DNA-binding XRE family transcriptional regulator